MKSLLLYLLWSSQLPFLLYKKFFLSLAMWELAHGLPQLQTLKANSQRDVVLNAAYGGEALRMFITLPSNTQSILHSLSPVICLFGVASPQR